jgi:hypothetical protein
MAMRILAFFLILGCFASVWASFGMLEVLAFTNGIVITMAAAAFVSSLGIEGE